MGSDAKLTRIHNVTIPQDAGMIRHQGYGRNYDDEEGGYEIQPQYNLGWDF